MATSLKRDAWILGSYLVLLFGTTSLVPQLWEWVASWSGPWHRLIPDGIGVLLTLFVLRTLVRQHSPTLLLRASLFILLVLLFFKAMGRLSLPIEKIHFSEYGFLSFLIFRLFRHWDRSRRLYAWTLTNVCLVGFLDETVQGLLPNRVYDPRDLGFNALAGLLGLSAVVILFDPSFLK